MRGLFALSLIAVALGGCAGQSPWAMLANDPPPANVANASSKQTVSAVRAAPAQGNGGYRLDSGDRVRVVVSGQDALSSSYEIDGNGAVEIPTLGAVSARGLNIVQLSGAIARRLKQNNVREAHVAVQIETYRPFTIQGEVANPGQYPYVNNMTTETAVAIAGGLKPRADKSGVTVSNADGEPPLVAAPWSAPVRPGDTVIVKQGR
jgi:polysaccharide biosynthesis/export protein